MDPIAEIPKPLTPEQILAQYGDELEKLVTAAQDPQFEFERQILVNKARLAWHFVKGNHFQVPGLVDTTFGQIVDYIPFDTRYNDDDNGAQVRFCYPINLIGGDCYKFVAVMGNAAPRVKAVADTPGNTQQEEDTKNADAIVRDLWKTWRADRLQRVMAFHQYTTGPTYWRTQWVTDARKYGQSVEPQLDMQSGPDGSMVPMESGQPRVYPNGDVELRGYTVLDVSHPYMAKTLDDGCGYFLLDRMLPKWDLLAAFRGEDGKPGPLDQYRSEDLPDDDASTSSTLAAEANESVAAPSGLGRQRRPNNWRFREWWFHPDMYEVLTNDALRKILQQQFSKGLYFAKVGKVRVAIDNRDKCEEWSVCKTGRGEKIMEQPISADAIPYQRALNDLVNLAIETVLRAIAKTIIDSRLVNRESLRENEAVPAEVILTATPVDGDMNKLIAQIPPARVSDQLAPLITSLRTLWQDNTGIRPEIAGGGETTQTYREAKQRRDQALLQLSPQAAEERYCWEQIGTNGVKMRARFGTGQVSVPRKGAWGIEIDVVDLARLTETGWHAEADDNFPVTLSDRFDKMWALLKEFPPEVKQALSILDPINLEETLELLQIPGFESVSEDQKQKTLADVTLLLAGSPIPGQPDPNTGQPGPQQPSIPVDPYDDHGFIGTFLPKWMISKTGQQQKQTNPNGFSNVIAFWQAHQQMAQPPQPPPPPPVRTNLNVSAKLEDMPPEFTNEVLQGASLPPMPAQTSPSPNAVAQAMNPQPQPKPQGGGGNDVPGQIPPVESLPGPQPPQIQ